MNIKFLLIGTSLSLVPHHAAAQCAVTDCLQLGYTSLKKCDNGLKCPFGEYWACPKVEEKAVLGQCAGYAKNCKIADILNSDGTCTTDKVSSKTPIGVVVYISDDNCGYAITINPIARQIAWSTEAVTTGIGTANKQTEIRNFDACANTQKLIQLGDSNKYPAAWTVVNYAPNAAPATKGKWCLPAPGMLNNLYINSKAINNTISKLGGTQFTIGNGFVWSSCEHNYYYAWVLDMGANDGSGLSGYVKDGYNAIYTVRPVIMF